MRNFYNQVPPKFRQGLWPYISAGIGIALLIFGLIIFSYLMIWGLLIGGVLFLIAWIRNNNRYRKFSGFENSHTIIKTP